MIVADFHIHTTFSDGQNSPAEYAAEALKRGMTAIGFSEHGYADCDIDCCLQKVREEEYVTTVEALREEYRGRLEIFCGLEQDFYSEKPPEGVEYIIGSVHFLHRGPDYRNVDWLPENLEYMAENWFGGDWIALAEEYYAKVTAVYEKTHCDVIGHFDLVSKLNGQYGYFDENDARYVAAWQKAADELLKTGKPFEINTGAIARGWRTVPYPAPQMQRYIADRGGSFIMNSDSHSADTLCFGFNEWSRAAEKAGYRLAEKPF